MKIYLDESMPGSNDRLLIGVLILSNAAHSSIHKKLLKLLKKRKFFTELKYSKIYFNHTLKVAKETLDLFFDYSDPVFRCVVVKYDGEKVRNKSKESLNEHRIKLYADVALKMIKSSITSGETVDIFMDEERRIEKTELRNKLLTSEFPNGAKINSVAFVKSHNNSNCLSQMADLLIGGVLQNLYPSSTKGGRFKKEFGEYLLQKSGFTSFEKDFWEKITLAFAKKYHSKVHISYWHVPYFKTSTKTKKKSRS